MNTRWSFRKVDNEDGSSSWRHVSFPTLTAEEAKILADTRDVLEKRLEPCSPNTIVTMLARLSNHYKNERSPQEWQALFRDYLDDLNEFSEPEVARAMIEHRRNNKWFPKICELRERCLAYRDENKTQLDRCIRVMREGGALSLADTASGRD